MLHLATTHRVVQAVWVGQLLKWTEHCLMGVGLRLSGEGGGDRGGPALLLEAVVQEGAV